jgi:citrate lyase subunit beta / citryl-CoA lyase
MTEYHGPALLEQERPFCLRRSCLAVPGSSPKMLQKAQRISADQVFLDLEDSVAPNAKAQARKNVIEAVRSGDWAGKTLVVRVNDCSTAWTFRDIVEVVGAVGGQIDCIRVPKVEFPGHVHFVDTLITQIERENRWELGRVGLEIQLDSSSGLVHLDEIARSSSRIETLIFGPGDMSAFARLGHGQPSTLLRSRARATRRIHR